MDESEKIKQEIKRVNQEAHVKIFDPMVSARILLLKERIKDSILKDPSAALKAHSKTKEPKKPQ